MFCTAGSSSWHVGVKEPKKFAFGRTAPSKLKVYKYGECDVS